jgi:hypothetical protein
MIRPTTSVVSALSGIVANGCQAIHSVSSAPSKIPYGGFSPVRLQTGCQPPPSKLAPLIGGHSGLFPGAHCFRSRACARRYSPVRSPHTSPVALGSASGYSVRQPHRLLWPHPSFCAAPPVLSYCRQLLATQKVPTFIFQSLMTCRRPYSDGSSSRSRILTTGLAFTHLVEVRQPCLSIHQSTYGGFNEAATFALCCGPSSCWPRSGRDVYGQAYTVKVTPDCVGYDYTSFRFTRDRTFTGCSDSFVGCTPNQTQKRFWTPLAMNIEL